MSERVVFTVDQVERMRSEISLDEFIGFMKRNPGDYHIKGSLIHDVRDRLASLTSSPSEFQKELSDVLVAAAGDNVKEVVVRTHRESARLPGSWSIETQEVSK